MQATFWKAKHLHPSLENSLGVCEREPVEDMMCYQALTSGSGIWEKTDDKHWDSSTAPQPSSRSWGGHKSCSPTILSPSFSLQPPCPVSPSSSCSLLLLLCVCLLAVAPFTGQDHSRWLMVNMEGFLPSTAFCCSFFLCLLLFYHNTTGTKKNRKIKKNTGGRHCSQLKTIPRQWREPTLLLGYIN